MNTCSVVVCTDWYEGERGQSYARRVFIGPNHIERAERYAAERGDSGVFAFTVCEEVELDTAITSADIK